ncbi:hypothetical protein BK142_23735 [Paenibacillus glucanolyticus]|nr:hypothetical protein BK142_23735 [Paenibacillus glucanolyticus]
MLDELDRVFTQIAETQDNNWDGQCSCSDCYWNMYDPIKRAERTDCVSESLSDTKMAPNTKDCPSYWSYTEACGEPKGGSGAHE